MSSYHSSFTYLGKNSKKDFNWMIAHFSDNADSGETDTYLSTSAVYTDSYDGTRQTFYGAKYDTVATPQITVIKQDGTDFGIDDNRKALRWLTGSRQATWMDFYIGDEVKYRLLGRVKSVSQYKMDARIVGLIITFESVSPYGYSSLQTVTKAVSGSTTMTIKCDSDEMYSYVYMNTIYQNNASRVNLKIDNKTTGDITTVNNIAGGEDITISNNMMITSDNPKKTFGSTFNFVYPRLAPGDNNITVTGNGTITFQYVAPVKLGDIAIDLNSVSDPICNENGEIQIDMLDWSRISNKPKTLSGYGISDAYPISSVYNKNEIDEKVNVLKDNNTTTSNRVTSLSSNLSNNYYSKEEIDSKLSNYSPPTNPSTTADWSEIKNKPTTLTGYQIKDEVQDMINNSKNDIYTKSQIDSMLENFTQADVYTKSEIDAKFEDIDVSGIDTYTKDEIDEKIKNITTSSIDINEEELNNMLIEVLGE